MKRSDVLFYIILKRYFKTSFDKQKSDNLISYKMTLKNSDNVKLYINFYRPKKFRQVTLVFFFYNITSKKISKNN